MNDLIKKATLAEIDVMRAQALEHFRQGAEHIAAGVAIGKKAAASDYFGVTRHEFDWIGRDRNEDFMRLVTRQLDRAIWRHALRATALADVMDAKARKDLEEALEKSCPPADFETMAATLQNLAAGAPQMMKRGVVELFKALSKNHRTNDRFKVGDKFILEHLFSAVTGGQLRWQHFSQYGRRDSLVDLERTLHVLDGRRPPDHSGNIANLIGAHVRDAKPDDPREFETDLLRVRWFMNGNAHVWIKRRDLLAKVNRIIAEHYGEVIPEGHAA